jgi:hypothetical protein
MLEIQLNNENYQPRVEVDSCGVIRLVIHPSMPLSDALSLTSQDLLSAIQRQMTALFSERSVRREYLQSPDFNDSKITIRFAPQSNYQTDSNLATD